MNKSDFAERLHSDAEGEFNPEHDDVREYEPSLPLRLKRAERERDDLRAICVAKDKALQVAREGLWDANPATYEHEICAIDDALELTVVLTKPAPQQQEPYEKMWGVKMPPIYTYEGFAKGHRATGVRCAVCHTLLGHGCLVVLYKDGLAHANCYRKERDGSER